jgi:hypothetical protein
MQLTEEEQRFLMMGEDEILEEVDEYLLYCFYLGFNPEMRVRYRSPVRNPDNADSFASWSLFTNTSRLNREYAWKDSGTGEFGDIFKLVMLILRCKNKASAVERIKNDFLFGKGTELARQGVSSPKNVDPAHIKLASMPLDKVDLQWWYERTGADVERLNRFNVRRVKYYWMYDHQNTPSFCSDRVYSYRIYDHYQLYFPHKDRDRRFRNDFSEDHLLGFLQLRYQSDTLIITKSMKDIITLDTLGFEAISPRGEHTPISAKFMEFLKTKYKRMFTLFDNDGKHRAWAYDCPSIELPRETGQKDSSDHYHVFGHDSTKQLIDSLIKNHPMEQIDLSKPMDRKEIEQFLDATYLGKVIRIQHVGDRKVKEVCGKIHRIAMDFKGDEPICIAMIDDYRYEFALGYFIQKAQIQQTDGYTRTTESAGE